MTRTRCRGAAAPVAVAVVVLLVAGAVAVAVGLGTAGSRWALPVAGGLATLAALAGGAALSASRGADPWRRRLMGLSMVLWSLGQGWVAALAAADPGTEQRLVGADVVQLGVVPLAVVAVLMLPRPSGYAGRRRQLALDAALGGLCVSALLWQLVFARWATGSPYAVGAAAAVVAELCLLVLCWQYAVASLDRGCAVAAAGAALFVAGDMVATLHLVQPGGTWPWVAPVLSCVAWPLVAVGFATAGRARLRAPRRLSADARTGGLTCLLVLTALAGTLVLHVWSPQALHGVTVFCFALALVTVVVRELLSRRQRAQLVASLVRQTRTDPLTGLANREALLEGLAGSPRPGTVLLVVDLDGFGEVDDRLGQETGDALLRAVAVRLELLRPPGWSAHRLDCDRYALLGPGTVQDAERFAERVRAAVRGAAQQLGLHPLGASAGVCALDDGLAQPAAALPAALAAVRAAKDQQRGRTVVHDAAVSRVARRRADVLQALRSAVGPQGATELEAHLQPIVDLATGKPTGFETLARWRSAALGCVAPDEFIPLAEATGLVVPVGREVLRRGMGALVAAGGVRDELRLTVNASVVELRTAGYVQRLRDAALDVGLPLDLLTVELTESTMLDPDGPAAAVLAELAAHGVRLAIDDFGTGYSSLSYLERLPVSTVKLDRSLVVGCERPRSRTLLRSVVGMCRDLGYDVVAEGVETREQMVALQGMGVTHGQGWYWSHALAPGALVHYLDGVRSPSRHPATG